MAKTKQSDSSFSTSFERAFEFLMEIEKGYVNDPRDPGGETKFGISKRAYPNLDIAALTEDDAKGIYLADYWEPCRCDELPPDVALAIVDCAVNQGQGIAPRILQQALKVKIDGIIGEVTLAAVNAADPQELLIDVLSWRGRRYGFTAGTETYLRGWLRRLFVLQFFVMTGKILCY